MPDSVCNSPRKSAAPSPFHGWENKVRELMWHLWTCPLPRPQNYKDALWPARKYPHAGYRGLGLVVRQYVSAAPRTVKWTVVVILHEVNLESKDIPKDHSFPSQTPPRTLCFSNLLKKLLILSNKYSFLASRVPQISSLPSVGAVQPSGPCLPPSASRLWLPLQPGSARHCALSMAFSDNWKKQP